MNTMLIVGIIAGCLTTAAFFPQVIKAHTSKQTKDLSLVMYLIMSAGLILWIIYGLIDRALPIIMANSITLMLSLYLIFLKIKYG